MFVKPFFHLFKFAIKTSGCKQSILKNRYLVYFHFWLFVEDIRKLGPISIFLATFDSTSAFLKSTFSCNINSSQYVIQTLKLHFEEQNQTTRSRTE